MVIVLVVFLVCLLLLIFNILYDKLTFITIKLNSIEEKINSTLIKRKELIKDSEGIIKEVVKTEKEIYTGFSNLNEKNANMMELDRKLLVYINEFYLIEDKYPELKKNEDFEKISFKITETEDLLNAYKNYYNDNANKYNKIIKQFPFIITTFIKRRKEKLFFDNKNINDNDYNDFKY